MRAPDLMELGARGVCKMIDRAIRLVTRGRFPVRHH